MKRHFDKGSLSVIVITLLLFGAAIVSKGFTHNLLLEAGVFLVSVKLVLMAYKNSVASESIVSRLDNITESIARIEKLQQPNQSLEPTPTAVMPAAEQPPRQP